MMKNYLTTLVDRQFARRNAALSKLHTAEDWMRHAEYIRKSMAAWTGEFPSRTPLGARVTGRVERQGYVMEKILFESRPDFLVSANLYLPKGGNERRPAVLNVIGHSPAGKATDKVQRRSIAQARKGFVALTIDAIGQGERQIAEYASYGRPPGKLRLAPVVFAGGKGDRPARALDRIGECAAQEPRHPVPARSWQSQPCRVSCSWNASCCRKASESWPWICVE